MIALQINGKRIMFNGDSVTTEDVKKFNSFARPMGNCLIWFGLKTSNNRGRMRLNGASITPQRFVALINGIKIPSAHRVCLKCGNSLCCAYNHISIEPIKKTKETENAK